MGRTPRFRGWLARRFELSAVSQFAAAVLFGLNWFGDRADCPRCERRAALAVVADGRRLRCDGACAHEWTLPELLVELAGWPVEVAADLVRCAVWEVMEA